MINKNLIKYLIILIVIFSLNIYTSSCQKKDDDDDFIIDENKRLTYVKTINITTNNIITYQITTDNMTTFISYYFENTKIIKKECYHFYYFKNDFDEALLTYQKNIDGELEKIDEKILLLQTIYYNLDQVSYDDLYQKTLTIGQIITKKEELTI